MELLAILAVCVGSFLFFYRRSLRYFRYFQQEEYDGARFARWFFANRAFDRRGTIVAAITGVITFLLPLKIAPYLAIIGAIAVAITAFREENPITTGKKKLAMTQRAKRIYRVALVLYAAYLGITAWIFLHMGLRGAAYFWLLQVLSFQICPIWLVIATAILKPQESQVQQGFVNEAKSILKKVDPLVIGITGSYGKTSTKSVLGLLLDQGLGPTFCPPKSINTVMGITREIRTNMRPDHKYAVIEMAAYKRGSIERLCAFTPPKVGIITNIGIMHLERFGSKENVYLAKSELARAIPQDGMLICNGDNEGSRRIAAEFPKKTTLLFGMGPGSEKFDCRISDIKSSEQGTSFVIHWKGNAYPAFTAMLGTPALSNILGAFTMACALGADPNYLVALVRNLQPEDNRLQAVRDAKGLWLRDAYNSNPIGFSAALDVLADLPGRKILVTPGMVELGDSQYEENRKAAEKAARVSDFIFMVGPTNRKAWVEGMKASGAPSEHYAFIETRDEALLKLNEMRREGDVVLIENDLPDLYEAPPRF